MKTIGLILFFLVTAYGGALLGQNNQIKKTFKLEENASSIKMHAEKTEVIIQKSSQKIKNKIKTITQEQKLEASPSEKTVLIENQWFYLYGTDSFDSEHNARCFVKQAVKTNKTNQFQIEQTCQGSKQNQEELQKLIHHSLLKLK